MKWTSFGLPAGVVVAGLVMSWAASPARALPPDPDNAALLYYQAFLTVADIDKEARDHIADVARGKVEPDQKVREDIGKCRAAIDLVEAARDLHICHWGLRYSQGFDALMPQLAQVRFLAYVIVADARVHASDGDYRKALDRCLMMGRLARHVGDDTLISYLVSVSVSRLGYECMEDLMGQAGRNVELLQWLKNELATAEGGQPFPVVAMKTEREIVLDSMRPENIEKLAVALVESDKDRQAQIIKGTTPEYLAKARRMYLDRITATMTLMSADIPYEQAHRQMAELEKSDDPNDPAGAVVGSLAPALVRVLTIKTMQQAHANAARVGADLCLHRARTGKLPEELPAGLPKDPFSGRGFQYERTDTGFVLRCQGKDLDKDTTPEFRFTVK